MLNGRYQLTHSIAAGGMGEVWRGRDLMLQRDIAVKVLLPALMNDREFITRFRSEARMLAQLRHPGIVQVYDYGADAVVGNDRFDYLVMEFIEGTSLSAKIQQAGRLNPAETMSIVAGMAEALHTAHQSGIIHRDVKPGNLLVRPGGALVLVDFGIARSVGITGITSTNVVLGSVSYMAPEQAEGKPVTAATDVYALGAVAYACLTGRPPYVGDNQLVVLGQLVHGPLPVLPPDVPRGVAQVVLRALAKDPAQRFPSGAALADAARNALRAPAAPPAPPGNWGTSTVRAQPAPYGATPPPPNRPWSGAAAVPQPPADDWSTGAQRADTGWNTGAQRADTGWNTGAQRAEPIEEPPRKRNLALVASAVGLVLIGAGVLWAVVSNGTDKPGPAAAAEGPQQPGPLTSPSHKGGRKSPTPTKRPATEPTGDTELPNEDETSAPAPDETEETNKFTPAQVCGDDYEVVDQKNLKSDAGVTKGRVYLLYRAADGSNCVVTLRTAGLAKKAAASAYLQVQGKDRVTDAGQTQYYSGPVEAIALNTCVKWGGSVGALTFDSEFTHCG